MNRLKEKNPEDLINSAYGRRFLRCLFAMEDKYLDKQKSQSGEIPKAILNIEEQLGKKAEYDECEKHLLIKQGQWLYIIKDHKKQNFIPELDGVLERFYHKVEAELKKDYKQKEFRNDVEYRKAAVKHAVLKQIKEFEMDNPFDPYGLIFAKKDVIIGIDFGHSDIGMRMDIIAGVGSSFSNNREANNIRINKDVFYPKAKKVKLNGGYLASEKRFEATEIIDV